MLTNPKNNLAKYLILIFLFAGLVGVALSFKHKQKHHRDKLYIVTTTSILADIAKNIVVNKAVVEAIIPPNTDPHEAKAPIKILDILSEAHLIIKNGLHLEGSLDEDLQPTKHVSKTIIYDASNALAHDDKLHYNGYEDPHFWFDPKLIIKVVKNLTDIIITLDNSNESFYRSNAQAYVAKIEKTLITVQQAIKRISQEEKFVILTHNSLGYLEKYGLDVKPIQGISTVGEPSLKKRQKLTNLIIQHSIPVIFSEKSTNDKTIDALIQECARRGHHLTKKLLYTDALAAKGQPATYIGMLEYDIKKLLTLISKK